MTDAELTIAIATVLGWTDIRTGAGGPGHVVGYRPESKRDQRIVPRFATSLDACFGPGGPVEYVKAKGWTLRLVIDEAGTYAAIHDGRLAQPFLVDASDDDAPRALCLAFLAAIEVMK